MQSYMLPNGASPPVSNDTPKEHVSAGFDDLIDDPNKIMIPK